MPLNYTGLFMSDIITLFENDLKILLDKLNNIQIIENVNIENISIDYSSKSKQGDLSTNIFLILNKKTLFLIII